VQQKDVKTMGANLFSEELWEKAWQECGRKLTDQAENTRQTVSHWEQRAASFSRNTSGEKNIIRQQQVLGFMAECGMQLAGAKILDIGSGPGNYAIPMAAEAEWIWALDPSPTMLEVLQERMAVRNLGNITPVLKTWQEVDLAAAGWRKNFDLVFAAMTPGIDNGQMLRKMIEASRGYCLLSKFAGPRRNSLQEKLWQRTVGGEYPGSCSDFIYPFNLLYSWGYYPAVRFFSTEYTNESMMGEAEKLLANWLEQYCSLTPEIMTEIAGLVREEAVDGIVRESVTARTGVMVWRCV